MKSLFIRIILPVFGIALISGVYTAHTALSAEKSADQTNVDSEVTELSDAEALIEGLVDIINYKKGNTGSQGTVKSNPTYSDNYNPTCINDYRKLYSSTTQKQNVEWALGFVAYRTQYGHLDTPIEQFVDINGDGLVDYIYNRNDVENLYYPIVGTQITQHTKESSCVYLNNGAGWDKAYQCFVDTQIIGTTPSNRETVITYYGDCAA